MDCATEVQVGDIVLWRQARDSKPTPAFVTDKHDDGSLRLNVICRRGNECALVVKDRVRHVDDRPVKGQTPDGGVWDYGPAHQDRLELKSKVDELLAIANEGESWKLGLAQDDDA